jgi:uncharacterized protein (DUF58 family)
VTLRERSVTLRERLAQTNFARLNYILIPNSPEERDKLRATWAGKNLGPSAIGALRALTRTGWGVALLMVFVGMGGLDVDLSSNHLLASVLFGVLVVSVAARRASAMHDVTVEVQAPPRVSVGQELLVRVTLRNRDARAYLGVQLERPFLPWDGSWVGPRLTVDELPAGGHATVKTRARFAARGRHYLDPFFAAEPVPMGLARGPGVLSGGSPVLVVPRVAPIRHLRLGLTPRFQPGGVALASKTGESSELYGLRPYRRGDRLRDLHARSWARTGKPVVREYQQEYFTRVGVFVDTELQATTERGFEGGISLAAGVVFALSRGEALIDLLVTGDTLHALTIGRSLGSFEQALDHLACVNPGPEFDATRTLDLLAPYLGRLSSVVLVVHVWDAPRQILALRLRQSGVSVKTLVVGEGPSSPDVSHVPLRQIEGDDAVTL